MFPWLTSRNEVHLQTVSFRPNLTLNSMQEFYCNFAEKKMCVSEFLKTSVSFNTFFFLTILIRNFVL